MKLLLLLGILLLAGLGGSFFFAFPSYTWHQKMTIEVEVGGQIYSGSSVVRVRWRKNGPLGSANGPAWIKTVRGEAPFVEIPGHSVLFSLLSPPHNPSYIKDLAFLVLAKGTQQQPVRGRHVLLLQQMDYTLEIPDELYPPFVHFSQIDDPGSVRAVDMNNLASSLGPGINLKRVTLEITNAPVTSGKIPTVLGWYSEYKNKLLRLNGERCVACPYNSKLLADLLSTSNFGVGD